MPAKFSRQDLYELVWAQPTRTVAATIEVSDVALAKACRKAEIPIPPRGYWARKAGKQTPPKPPLPPRFPGAADTVEFGGKTDGYGGPDWRQGILNKPIPPEPVFEESIELVGQRIQKMVGKVPSQKNFDKAFGDISRLLAHDEERRKSSWSYDKPRYDSGIERRRLLIVNSLYLAFSALGCRVDMSTSKYQNELQSRGISVRVGSQHVYFTLEASGAKGWRVDMEAHPSTLRLGLGSPHANIPPQKIWVDTIDAKLESYLHDVVIEILLEGERQHRDRAITHRQWMIERRIEVQKEIAREQAERERKLRELQEKKAKQRIDDLLRQAADIQKAQTIRDYVRLVHERASKGAASQEKLQAWENWALGEADRIDPTLADAFLELLPNGDESDDPSDGGE